MTPGLLTLNSTIDGYTLLKELGRGGMGAVYLAEKHGRHYALKFNLASADPEAQLRFQREAEAVAQVDRHPLLVKVHHFGQLQRGSQRYHFLVFDYIDGDSLDKIIERGPVEEDQCLKWAEDIAEALAHIHSQGIIHRDLKPANIMIRASDRRALLADFGLAKIDNAQTLTKTGEIMGTPAYMAPEHFNGQETSPAVDQWALGVALFEMLTGRRPFQASSPVALSVKILSEPVDLSELPCRPRLADIIKRLLSKDPSQRPSSSETLSRLKDPSAAPSGSRKHWLRRSLPIQITLLLLAVSLYALRTHQRASQRQALRNQLKPYVLYQRELQSAYHPPHLWLAQSLLKTKSLKTGPEPLLGSHAELKKILSQSAVEPPKQFAPTRQFFDGWASLLSESREQTVLEPSLKQLTELKRAFKSRNIDQVRDIQSPESGATQRLKQALLGQLYFDSNHWSQCIETWQQLDAPWSLLIRPRLNKARGQSLLTQLFNDSQRNQFSQSLKALLKLLSKDEQEAFWPQWNNDLHSKFKGLSGAEGDLSRLRIVEYLETLRSQFPGIHRPELGLPGHLTLFKRARSQNKRAEAFFHKIMIAIIDPKNPILGDFQTHDVCKFISTVTTAQERRDSIEVVFRASQKGYVFFAPTALLKVMVSQDFISNTERKHPNEPALDFWRGFLTPSAAMEHEEKRMKALADQVTCLRRIIKQGFVKDTMRAFALNRLARNLRHMIDYFNNHDRSRIAACKELLSKLSPKLKAVVKSYPLPDQLLMEWVRVQMVLDRSFPDDAVDDAHRLLKDRLERTKNNRLEQGRAFTQPLFPCIEQTYNIDYHKIEVERFRYYFARQQDELALKSMKRIFQHFWKAEDAVNLCQLYLRKGDKQQCLEQLQWCLKEQEKIKADPKIREFITELKKQKLWPVNK